MTTIITDDPAHQRTIRARRACAGLERIREEILDDLRARRCTVKEARDRICELEKTYVSDRETDTSGTSLRV